MLSGRHRGLLFMAARDPHLLFFLRNYAFRNESIATGVFPFSDKACTILLDIQIGSNPTSEEGATTQIISCGTTFTIGKRNASHTYYQIRLNGTWSGAAVGVSTTSAPGRKRFAVMHEALADQVVIIARMDNHENTETTKTWTFSLSDSELRFGGNAEGPHLTTGIINKAAVYDIILPEKKINRFFA